jgi:predicted N-acetyltransferase YhbS
MTAFPIAAVPQNAQPHALLAPHGRATFALERPQDAAQAQALIERAFGPGRFAKTAERLREGNRLRADLSICAWDGERMAGVVQQWPLLVGGTPAVFLGPFAVDREWRNQKLGRALIERGVALNDAAGERLTVLVGDRSYFGPLGFEPAPPKSDGAARLVLPGPVDPRRVMWRPRPGEDLAGVAGLLSVPPQG